MDIPKWLKVVLVVLSAFAIAIMFAVVFKKCKLWSKSELTLEQEIVLLKKKDVEQEQRNVEQDARFDRVDKFASSLSERFGSVENRLGNLGTRVDKVSKRLARLEARSVDLRVRSRRMWSVSSRLPYPPSGRIWPVEPVVFKVEKTTENERQDEWRVEPTEPTLTTTSVSRPEPPSMEAKLP